MTHYYWFRDELDGILELDDKERFVELLHRHPDEVGEHLLSTCAFHRAKKCLTALVNGEVSEPPPALDGCATCIHRVAWSFPDLDVVNIMLMRGAIKDLNINYKLSNFLCGTPLHLVLNALSVRGYMHLDSWSPGDSIYKLITLLCMWEMKHHLDIARTFACYTDSVNDSAWCFLENGKLMQLAALLLVAQKKVMVPFETGMTIKQRLTNKIDELTSEVHHEYERVRYKSLLLDVSKLFDVFERAGDELSAYCCTSLHEDVSPKKVVVDVVGMLKKAGLVLQIADLDLRDCYRGHHELWSANLFKMSDSDKKFPLHMYPNGTGFPGFGTALGNIPSRHWDPLIAKLKSREVLNLAAATPGSRLLSTVAGAGAGLSIPPKHLAYVAMKLKRGVWF